MKISRSRLRQNGIAMLAYLLIALGVLGTLGGIAWGIDSRGYNRGAAAVRDEWSKANLAAEQAAELRRIEAAKAVRKAQHETYAARAAAETYQQDWRAARDQARRNKRPLVVASCPKASTSGAELAAGPPGDSGDGVRVSWEFVSLWDSAWTGAAGEPVFADPGGILAAAGGPDPALSSPYDPGQVLDNHQENAVRCSTDRRQLVELVAIIKDLRARWSPDPGKLK